MIKKYLNWLQKDNPVGLIERYPEIDHKKESSLKGLYIAGDLTGIPLLKLAAESGCQLVKDFILDPQFINRDKSQTNVYDLIIIGAGPAGLSAALEAQKNDLNYLVLESSQNFDTIENFPKGKPILAKPDQIQTHSALRIQDGNKESLLKILKEQVKNAKLNIENNFFVQKINREDNYLKIEADSKSVLAHRCILAIGKSGNARKLNVPGENQAHVFNKLYDPSAFQESSILVVGGGDSAIEASIALANAGNTVHHSYRKNNFARPKEENLNAFEKHVTTGAIQPLFGSEVKEISENDVTLIQNKEKITLKCNAIFTLIGRELPLQFFKRSNIKMEGEKSLSYYFFYVAMLSFFSMLYFGKSGYAFNAFEGDRNFSEMILSYFQAPFQLSMKWSPDKWYISTSFVFGWLGSIIFIVSGLGSLFFIFRNASKYFESTWGIIKYTYLIFVAVFFTSLYFKTSLNYKNGISEWVYAPTYWYSFFYCTTMALFAWRRVNVKKTTYVRRQMISVVLIQVIFLFLLPFHLYEPLIENSLGKDHWFIQEVFPSGKWTCFAFILIWPLNLYQFGTSTFWTWFPFLQSGIGLFFLMKHYGKGAYCGWICSCGGMAETLGDEYRNKAPHGPKAKKLENIGQWVLLFAFLTTTLSYFHQHYAYLTTTTQLFQSAYKLLIDIFFAGVLGLGVYFFLGGRIWCRFGCPLAALMHIYTRFSRYRIFSEKKKCISCNICTKVCHMGIDVMNFANKGIPMNDVECVRCSTCVTSCPMEVLSFGKLDKSDTNNNSRQEVPSFGKKDWRAAIK